MRGQAEKVYFPGLGFQKNGREIGNNAIDDLVKVWAAPEIQLVGFQSDATAAFPRFQPERPCSHRITRKRRSNDILPFQNVFGQNGVHPGYGGTGIRHVIAHFKRQRPGLPVLLNVEKICRIRRGRFGIGHQSIGEGHVIRCKRSAVLPLQPGAQPETHEASIVGNFPLLGGELHNLQIFVILKRRCVQQPRDFLRSGV